MTDEILQRKDIPKGEVFYITLSNLEAGIFGAHSFSQNKFGKLTIHYVDGSTLSARFLDVDLPLIIQKDSPNASLFELLPRMAKHHEIKGYTANLA